MGVWNLYKKGAKIKVGDKTAKGIIKELAKKVLTKFYSENKPIKKDGERTTKLFEVLTLMGDEKGYKVCSHSLSKEFMDKYKNEEGNSKFVNREWLYDLLWYTEEEGYYPIDFPLIVESEWRKKRKEDKTGDKHSAIKYDFQKLLLPNTGLRLMIFKVSEEEKEKATELDSLSDYFTDAIAKYKPLEKGRFLFIAFHDKKKSFYYWYKEKINDAI